MTNREIRVEPQSFDSPAECRAFVENADKDFFARLDHLTRALAARQDVRIIGLGGPTCSGKTTAAKMLLSRMQEAGKRMHLISVDDFFKEQPNVRTAKEIDMDSVDALDLPLFVETFDRLMQTGVAAFPKFDLGKGIRLPEKQTVRILDENDILFVEGIQVVYPEIQAVLRKNDTAFFSMFIHVASSLQCGEEVFAPEDIRYYRRIVRDYYFRESGAAFTMRTWPGVRKNEIRSIYPNIGSCSEIIDSLMPYEIGVLKPHLARIFEEISADDPYKNESKQILARMENTEAIAPENIGEDSLYREFLPLI